jgi:hypothetical protein
VTAVRGNAFPHRRNENGIFDSICPSCFATVASNEDEAKLRPIELGHACDPIDIYRISQGCPPRIRALEEWPASNCEAMNIAQDQWTPTAAHESMPLEFRRGTPLLR